MEQTEWVCCPVCGQKTRIQIRSDTVLINFPLFCPKCKQERLINVKNRKIFIVQRPDAKTQC
ncbi:cysteine-rich KTR domain-containing protein [Lacrimispora indolis]|uniref:cysteine-rich KTR domain-containing protein n=1 Tax=Lacrimispora indolis TaxID=69825 RepID=UPI0009FF6412|nr:MULTISPECIES: cysteine-rich KTR domain-containing protein [Lachnospiraceae]